MRHRSELMAYASADDLTKADARAGGLAGLAVQRRHTGVPDLSQSLPTSLSLPTIPGTIVDNLLWLAITRVLLVAGLLSV